MSHLKNPNVRIESSRDSGVVIMNGVALVDMFMDSVSLFLSLLTINIFGPPKYPTY
jgi:homeobox-leucine zipper protein